MASTHIGPAAVGGSGSVLRDFLAQTTIYEKAGAVVPRELLQFGVVGSAVMIGTGLLSVILPSEAGMRSSGFFLLLGGLAAGVAGVLNSIALPASLLGVGLLRLDIYLAAVPTSEYWRWAVVGQAGAGAVGGVFAALLMAVIVLNLAIWIVLGVALMILVGMMLAALASG